VLDEGSFSEPGAGAMLSPPSTSAIDQEASWGGESIPPSRKTVSIVVPCLNEELVIGEFVDWCKEGLKKAGLLGQILIIDSSCDRSAEIAQEHGAEVLRTPKRGLGRAYIDALPHITGDYVIMGDCDLTYDFRDIKSFVDKLEQGHDFVMGSRFKGYIEPGAMPKLHQYFGTPVTTWILNFMYGTRYSDIHCGMRAMTREALSRINLESQSWEYASEMVLKAAKLRLNISEVPVRFYKDRDGRLSHHKRAGWLSPWRAGWINLKVMFLYAPDFFLMKPGWIMFVLGLLLTTSLIGGPYQFGGVGLDLHSMLLGITLTTLGYSAVQFATLAQVFYNFDAKRRRRLAQWLTYNRGVGASAALGLIGFGFSTILLINWIRGGLLLHQISYPTLFGLMLLVLGFQTFTFTLLFHMIHMRYEGRMP
jgi:glycosyltransferase involved in cell wall biosynthesis